MTTLTTKYLGISLSSPLVPSPSPLCRSLDNLKRMEDAGAGAVVLHSLFEEQINAEAHTLDHYLTHGAESFAEALSYFPEPQGYRLTPAQYLEFIRKAKAALGIPVIASLNGVSTGGWVHRTREADWVKYARLMQQAGADALELNLYFIPTDPEVYSDTVEDMYADLLIDVKQTVDIPLVMKLGPYFSSLPNMVQRLEKAGASGLVLFNRFYQPDLDIEDLDVVAHVLLSDSDDLRLPLRWIAILYGRTQLDLALSTGVHTSADVIKGLMAGAQVTMMTSELLQHGIGRLRAITTELQQWMDAHEYESVDQLRGSLSQKRIPFPAAYERAQYVKVVGTWEPVPG